MKRRLYFVLPDPEHARAAVALAVMAATVTAGCPFVQRLPHTHLDEFRQAHAHGEVLPMADVPPGRVAEIEALMHRRHPESVPGGASWTVDALRA